MHQLLNLSDAHIKNLVGDARVRAALPQIAEAYTAATAAAAKTAAAQAAACRPCARAALTRQAGQAGVTAVKQVITRLGPKNQIVLKALLDARQVRLTYRDGANRMLAYTF